MALASTVMCDQTTLMINMAWEDFPPLQQRIDNEFRPFIYIAYPGQSLWEEKKTRSASVRSCDTETAFTTCNCILDSTEYSSPART